MLTQLIVKNFGLIDQLTLDFNARLNVFTGETGAGKSILIGALRIVLGDRVSIQQFRDVDKPCQLQATFDLAGSPLWREDSLGDFGNAEDGELIIHRLCSPDGKSKIKINGLTATISQLKDIGNLLIDFHGPHDHQRLLSEEHHLPMLDRLIDFTDLRAVYAEMYREYLNKQKQLRQLEELRSSSDRDLDVLEHQVKELQQVKLDEDVYEQLRQDQIRFGNVERLFEYLREALIWLNGDEQGSSPAIRKAFYPLQRLVHLDPAAQEFLDRLSSVQQAHDQLVIDLRDYSEGLAFETADAQRINDQCDAYADILRKYGPAMSDARTFYENASLRLEKIMNLEHNDKDLRDALADIRVKMKIQADQITKLRRKAAKLLKQTIEKELSELSIKNVQFEARVESADFGSDGMDNVVFYISPNAGEALKPLAEIVSSGEAARVMLALKKALIQVDPVPVLIFDEIDAQIGGRLGTITGQKLSEISRTRQVILITHLPQIASFADQHFKVLKIVKDGRALTTVENLDADDRIQELAQMMSGSELNDISLKHAKDMRAKAQKA